jgi:GTP pyrophosphokinase
VLVIKLADRLHNMRTLHYLRPDKASRIATETLEIYARWRNRLGMNTIKWELDGPAFLTLHPKVYDEIVRLVADRAPPTSSSPGVRESARPRARRSGRVTGRPKHYYSIYQK